MHGVGAELNAGADFAELRCLFVDLNIETRLEQASSRREPAYPPPPAIRIFWLVTVWSLLNIRSARFVTASTGAIFDFCRYPLPWLDEFLISGANINRM